MCGYSDEHEHVKLWLWMSSTLTLRRSCCSACRLRWSRPFYPCCPVGGRGNNRGNDQSMMCWFHLLLWFVLRLLHFAAYKIWQFWLQGWFLIERDTERRRQGRHLCGQAIWIQIKKLPVVFFSHRVLRTSWHIPKTFQPQIPNVTPPDTSKEAAPAHWAQIKACFAQRVAQWKILHWQELVYSRPWRDLQRGENCL